MHLIQGLAILSLTSFSIEKDIAPIHKGQPPFQGPLESTLKEVLRGPLQGRYVTLLLEGSCEEDLDLRGVLEALGVPVLVLDNKEVEVGGSDDLEGSRVDAVLVLVCKEIPWPLDSPPFSWSALSLVLVGTSLDCDPRRFLQTQLALQTPSVAALCPEMLGTERNHLVFYAYTWRPLHPSRHLVSLGRWNASRFATWDQLFVDRFSSFHGVTLGVASDHDDAPFVFNTSLTEWDGLGLRILNTLAEALNFSYTLTPWAEDELWAEWVNDSWTGMLRDLHIGSKNLTINQIAISPEVAEYFDVSFSYYRGGYSFVLAVPPPLPRWQSLIYPFSGLVWAVVGGSVVVMFLVYYALASINNDVAASKHLLIILQALLNQSSHSVPSTWILRCFVFSWWLMAFVIVISYTCNLIAFLTIPAYPVKMTTIQELADSHHRICMLDYGHFLPTALATSTHRALSILGKKLDLVPLKEAVPYYNALECFDKVLKGTHAQTETTSYLKNMVEEVGHGEDTYYLKDQIYEGATAFFFRKNTPWRYKFDRGMARLLESGNVGKWYNDIINALRRSRKGKKSKGPVALTPSHLQGTFLIMGLGWLVGLLVFITERYFGTRNLA